MVSVIPSDDTDKSSDHENFLSCQIGMIWPGKNPSFGCHGSRLVAMETNSLRSSPDWEPTFFSSLVAVGLLTGIQSHNLLVAMAANGLPWKPMALGPFWTHPQPSHHRSITIIGMNEP